MDILRIITAGSVDDGKSTLIGRLLYDAKVLLNDQLKTLEKKSRERGFAHLDFSLLTDGLKEEMQNNITIDVAYRFFNTADRKYILADTPGHIEFIRNFITGASLADVAILLVDARNGVTEQTRRHAYLASLMGVSQLIFCVNKMDLVGYAEDVFEEIKKEIRALASKFYTGGLSFIPVSALMGDNIMQPSANMPWYRCGVLFHLLEQAKPAANKKDKHPRFLVQAVFDDRGHQLLAGQVVGGSFGVGDEIIVWPQGINTEIKAINNGKEKLTSAALGRSVTIELTKDVTMQRGALISSGANMPQVSVQVYMTACCFAGKLEAGRKLVLRSQNNEAEATITAIHSRLEMDTATYQQAAALYLHDIGEVYLELNRALPFDPYAQSRYTGSMILIDPETEQIAAIGLIKHNNI